MNISHNSFRMKCYFHCKQNCFLDYFDDPFLDDAVIYTNNIPFQYMEKVGRYTEIIGNPTGTIFVAVKRDHKFLLSQRSNTPNMSSNLNNFRQLHVTENCSNFKKIAFANTSDISHHMYHIQKRDADVEYLGRVKMVLSSHVHRINFADPANMRKAQKQLMIQVRTEAMHFNNKYKIPIEPIQFEWDRFLPTLENDLPEILNERLRHNSQQQPPNLNKIRSTPNENREQYNGGIDNRKRTLTTL